MSRTEPDPPPPAPEELLEEIGIEGVEVADRLGEGRRSLVYAARWRGRDAALKVYKPRAIARHARRHPLPLAEFEHRQNERYHGAPGLAPFVAEPFARGVGPRGQAFLQERLDGRLYYFYHREREGRVAPELFPKIERIVEDVFPLNNQYWLSFYVGRSLHDKRYIFLPESIQEENFTTLPLMNKRGVMIQ